MSVICRVDHDQIPVTAPVDDDVVDDATVFVQHGGILGLADLQQGNVIDGDVIEILHRPIAENFDSAHVGNIEETCPFTDSHVFIDNTAVGNRHAVTGKRHHTAVGLNMNIVERCLPQITFPFHAHLPS